MHRAGLVDRMPFRRVSFPTWEGYIKPFTEQVMRHRRGKQHLRWEDVELDEFADAADSCEVKVPLMRIVGARDPIIMPEHCTKSQCFSVLWIAQGTHCDQFYWSTTIGVELRKWCLEQHNKSRVQMSR